MRKGYVLRDKGRITFVPTKRVFVSRLRHKRSSIFDRIARGTRRTEARRGLRVSSQVRDWRYKIKLAHIRFQLRAEVLQMRGIT